MEREIQVGIDVGWDEHVVEILKADGEFERMKLSLTFESFDRLLGRLEELRNEYRCRIVIGIEGSNGHASPLDEYLISKGYRVYNTSGSQLNRFRWLYGAEFKNDEYDGKLICTYPKNRIAEEVKGRYVSYLADELIRKMDRLKELEKRVEERGKESATYKVVDQLAGAGSKTTSRLAGEIGNIDRVRRGEASLAAYCGVCELDNDSGKSSRNKKNNKSNRRAKNAMLELAHQSTRFNEESRRYYAKKRGQGKTHLHALRCLARHMTRKLYKQIVAAQKGHIIITLWADRTQDEIMQFPSLLLRYSSRMFRP